ncbi:sirohydrochlorin chelatase [Undibacterium hunanense]|nr:CbiX/SirB N-terminal domain-containing protein [Undibacterium hunanense]
MGTQSAMILFAHGARDPRWAQPFQRLQKMTQESLPGTTVALAFLEFMQPSLPELVASLVKEGCQQVTLVPIFLGQGGHVLRDLPVLVDELRVSHPALEVKLVSAAGEDDSVLSAIRDYCLKAL